VLGSLKRAGASTDEPSLNMMREMTDGAREIAQFNLPFMDGNHECIPRIASGQQFFAEFLGFARRLKYLSGEL